MVAIAIAVVITVVVVGIGVSGATGGTWHSSRTNRLTLGDGEQWFNKVRSSRNLLQINGREIIHVVGIRKETRTTTTTATREQYPHHPLVGGGGLWQCHVPRIQERAVECRSKGRGCRHQQRSYRQCHHDNPHAGLLAVVAVAGGCSSCRCWSCSTSTGVVV